MSKLYPAHFKEWDTTQGTEYTMYFYDFAGVSVKSGSFIDVCRAATMALKEVATNIDELPTPSSARHGDVMIKLEGGEK